MKIKRLEIQGFKSFPDRTVFKFNENGFTVVVGPNGCGKSNVVDAVRWALGEQSVKMLRGTVMEDVIFTGSERRKPLGLAEVTLVFDNSAGTAAGTWRDYAEITVTRRLFRNGESDYLINGVACRLKDVRELLMDAGSSSRGYSIVEQGRISLLINSKPEEKRQLIEEAAGILKYRVRRTEAERKLEKTRQNLLRVADVTREVKRQHDGMQRNAEKARKYRELRGELDRLVLRHRYEEFRRLNSEAGALEADLTRRQETLAGQDAHLRALEAREEALRLDLTAGEEKVSTLFEEVRRGESEVARMEGDIQVRQHAVSTLEERIAKLTAEIEELAQKKDSEKDGVTQLELTLSAIAGEHARSAEVLAAAQQGFAEAEGSLKEAGRVVEETRGKVFSLGTERSRLLSEIDSHDRTLEGLARRKAEIGTRSADLDRRVKEAEETRERRRQGAERLRGERETLAVRLSEAREALAAGREELAVLEKELGRQSERLAELRGLQTTLSALEEEMEGFSEGVRTVLREYAAATPGAGVVGTVADRLEVPPAYEKAVLALLGEKLQNVIVEGPEAGLSAVGFLKGKGSGRGSFIPRQPRPNGRETVPSGTGVVGLARELVRLPADLAGVGEALFGNAVVVEDLDRALQIWKRDPHGPVLVTLEGEVLEPSGTVTGGGVESRGADLLARKRRLRETVAALAEAEQTASAARARREAVKNAVDSHSSEIHSLEDENREKERALIAEEGALTVAGKEQEHLRQALADLSSEHSLIHAETEEITARASGMKGRLEEAERAEGEAKAALQAAQLRFEELSLVLNDARGRLEQARLSLSTVALRKESSERELLTARSRTLELDQRRSRMTQEIGEAQGRIAAHREAVAAEHDAVRAGAESLAASQRALVEVREAQEAARAEADALAASVRSQRQEMSGAREEASTVDIRLHEMKAERENLLSRTRDEHHRELAEVKGEEFGEEAFDPEAAATRVTTLREKLSSLGDVNPGAVEEFEELSRRLEFLTRQKDDLEQSMAQLAKAIRQINKTSRELFLTTFAEIKARFAEVLPTLYEGSRGEMVLLDEEDPLNSGIEIHVSPPGKKLRSMQLLSGGEKALVALGMIFTIFLVKPSPFCILDEVDAPLDERNLGNIVGAMKKMAEDNQFLVITHNKQTMEAADILYGVTMREPGVSQVVAVQLNRGNAEEAAA